MKILYHHRIRGVGAEAVHVRAIVEAFRLKGYQVRILSFPGTDVEAAEKSALKSMAGVKGYYISVLQWLAGLTKNAPNFIFELFEILYNILIPFRMGKLVKEFKPDFIYERYSLFMFVSVWLANKYAIPIILEVNDAAYVSRIRPLVFKRLALCLEKWLFKHCTGIVFVSSYFRNLALLEHGEIAPTVICPNAAELSKFDPSHFNQSAIRSKLGLENKVVCGYTGGFGKWHGIEWFIQKIIPQLKANPNYCLLLVGDGATFQDVSNLIKREGMVDQIILTGRVKHNEVPKYLSVMDFSVLPDLNEYCSPMKLFESMAMYQGMVLPSSEPVKEVVDDGNTSWLFPINDKDACIEKVMNLFAEPRELARVGKKARAYIERERQWSHNAELTLTLLPKRS